MADDTPHHFRWRLGAEVLLAGIIVQQAVWHWLAPDRTMQIFSVYGIVPLTVIVLLVWWMLLSGLTWKSRGIGLGVFVFIAAMAFAVFRVDGYSGEMIPQIALRWKPTRGQKAEQFRQETARPVLDDAPAFKEIVLQPGDWPEFRGPLRDGVVRGGKLRRNWDEKPPREVWRHPVGPGWSSFAVIGPLALTQEQRGEEETVVCYEFDTGREVWSHGTKAHFVGDPAGEGPRATPTVQDGRVYCMGAMGMLSCLALETGKLLWSHETLEENDAKNPEWGTAASPLVLDDVVVVNPGGPKKNAVVAYDRITGKKVWSAGSDPAAYCSPQLAELHGTRQVLIFDGIGLAGHDTANGKELWKFNWTNSPKINVAQPFVLEENCVYLGSGYSKGSVVISVKHTGKKWWADEVWSTRELKLKFNNAVVRAGYIYGLDEGILVCLDLSDGKRKWKSGRYGYGQMLLVDDLLLIQTESGELVLVDAVPDGHREVNRFRVLDGICWNPPVLCRGKLLVRNNAEATCYTDLLLDTSFP